MNCNIIRDLLPLYAENMVSQESRELIEDHLGTCPQCEQVLKELEKLPKIPPDIELDGLKRVKARIQKKRVLTAVAAVLTVVSVLVTCVIFMMTPIYLTAKQAIEGIELRENGSLAIDCSSGIMGHGSFDLFDEESEFHLCHTTRYDYWRGKLSDPGLESMSAEEQRAYIQENIREGETYQQARDRILHIRVLWGVWKSDDNLPYPDSVQNSADREWLYLSSERDIWYVNPGNPYRNTLIWDGSPIESNGVPDNDINSVYLILFAACVLLTGGCFLLAGKRSGRNWEVLRTCALLTFSTAVAILLTTGGNLVTLVSCARYKWPGMIVCESITLTLTLLTWRRLQLLNKCF